MDKDATWFAYCDGSNYQGRGGYGIVVCCNGQVVKEVSKTIDLENVTNNVAELCAILEAIKLAPSEGSCRIFSDSQYAIQAIAQWYDGWVVNGWLTYDSRPVANKELIIKARKEYDKKKKRLSLVHVKGHNGNVWNHFADHLAGLWRHRVTPESARSGDNGKAGEVSQPTAFSTNDGGISVLKLVQHYQRGTLNDQAFLDKLNRILKMKGDIHVSN